MTWNQGDQKTKKLLLSETKLRSRPTVVKATAQFGFAGSRCFPAFARLEFYLHLLARYAGECKSSDNYPLERTLRVAHFVRYRPC